MGQTSKRTAFAIAASIAVLVGGGFAYIFWPRALPPPPRVPAPPGSTVLIGDSNMWAFGLGDIGDCRTVNDAIPGTGAADLAATMPLDSGGIPPRYELVMIGTNDAVANLTSQQVEQFSMNYRRIVNAATDQGTTLLPVTILPIEPGKERSGEFTQASVDQLNAVIRSEAAKSQLELIDLDPLFLDEAHHAKVGMTRDGVHVTAPSKLVLYDAFDGALRSAMARSGKTC